MEMSHWSGVMKRGIAGGVTLLSDRDISVDPGHVGNMTICQVGTVIVAKLHAAGDDACKTAMFPELWRAKGVAMNANRMLFQNYERQGNQADQDAPH